MPKILKDAAGDLAVILLILVAPYLAFALHHSFIVEVLNLWLLAGFVLLASVASLLIGVLPARFGRVLVLTTVLLFFIDLQFDWIQWWGKKLIATAAVLAVGIWVLHRHISTILTTIFGTFIATTALAPYAVGPTRGQLSQTPESPSKLPAYIHIVLDGQIGLQSPSSTKTGQRVVRDKLQLALLEFYGHHGFHLYGGAYSPYYLTVNSLASAFNLESNDFPGKWYRKSARGYSFELINNEYFDRLSALGYQLNIYQSTYLDYCSAVATSSLGSCHEYKFDGVSSQALRSLDTNEKAKIVLSMYGASSVAIEWLRQRSSAYWPKWSHWGKKVGPIPVIPEIDRLTNDLRSAKRGTAYFAHLLIPHGPYSVDDACKIRTPVLDWKGQAMRRRQKEAGIAFDLIYRDDYEAYASQVQCVHLKLEQIFTVLSENEATRDAIITIHGDHGSRIVESLPVAASVEQLSEEDYTDLFSTLFAFRAPSTRPGYDPAILDLSILINSTLAELGALANDVETKSVPFIYLRNQDLTRSKMTKFPVPVPH